MKMSNKDMLSQDTGEVHAYTEGCDTQCICTPEVFLKSNRAYLSANCACIVGLAGRDSIDHDVWVGSWEDKGR